MLVVYVNYVQRMENVTDEIENNFNRADSLDEIDNYFNDAIEKIQSIYWKACDDSRIRVKELQKLEDLQRWCCRDVRNAYNDYIYNLENDIFAPDSIYDI